MSYEFLIYKQSLVAGRLSHQPRDPAEHPGAHAPRRAGRLLRAPQDGLAHPPLLRRRRHGGAQDLLPDVGDVMRL